MKTLTAICLLLVAATAQAGPISLLNTWGGPANLPTTVKLAFTPDAPGVEPGTRPDLIIALIEAPLDSAGLGVPTTITEANAGDFNLDWNAFEAAFVDPAKPRLSVGYGANWFPFGPIEFTSWIPELRDTHFLIHDIEDFDLEQIELVSTAFGTHVTTQIGLIGTGILIPEPSAALLFLLVCHVSLGLRSRRPPRNRPHTGC